jgi:hypothetical protein
MPGVDGVRSISSTQAPDELEEPQTPRFQFDQRSRILETLPHNLSAEST